VPGAESAASMPRCILVSRSACACGSALAALESWPSGSADAVTSAVMAVSETTTHTRRTMTEGRRVRMATSFSNPVSGNIALRPATRQYPLGRALYVRPGPPSSTTSQASMSSTTGDFVRGGSPPIGSHPVLCGEATRSASKPRPCGRVAPSSTGR
jgi:hypothetical protein